MNRPQRIPPDDHSELADPCYATRGFLPDQDPLASFPPGSPYAVLDEIGRDLPSLLYQDDFRSLSRQFVIPAWTDDVNAQTLPALRLYYVRLGFLASGYVNQVGFEPATKLPPNIAVPLANACALLHRPPILSYDGYALFNWKRFRQDRPIRLGNIDTIQNFVHLYDEHWFILVHVEIEAIAAEILAAIACIRDHLKEGGEAEIEAALWRIAGAVERQAGVLRRIPEHMDSSLYYKTFRPYIRFFDQVTYEGTDLPPMRFRGETGAQSSIMPALLALAKIPHQPSPLTDHLADMRQYMPARHRTLLHEIEVLPGLRLPRYRDAYNALLEAIVTFRRVHYGWAQEYVNRWTDDPRGTGGTPYMAWLKQLLEETVANRL